MTMEKKTAAAIALMSATAGVLLGNLPVASAADKYTPRSFEIYFAPDGGCMVGGCCQADSASAPPAVGCHGEPAPADLCATAKKEALRLGKLGLEPQKK
jgi:hypothetical protein